MPDNVPEVLPPEVAFPLLEDPNSVLALFDERLASGESLPILDLPRIRVAGGGAVNFRVETPEGEETPRKIRGILSAYRTARVYWKSRNAGKKPPDCSSKDGFTGVGDPGGKCADCPFARFGSAFKPDGTPSNGQACKDVRQALFLMEGEMLPHLISIPPTSLKAFNQYTLTMISARAHYWGAYTEMTLQAAESDEGMPYAKIIFRLGQRITDEKGLRIFQMFHERMKSVLKPAIVDATAYEVDEGQAAPALVSAPRPAGAARRVLGAPPAPAPTLFPPQAAPADDDIPF